MRFNFWNLRLSLSSIQCICFFFLKSSNYQNTLSVFVLVQLKRIEPVKTNNHSRDSHIIAIILLRSFNKKNIGGFNLCQKNQRNSNCPANRIRKKEHFSRNQSKSRAFVSRLKNHLNSEHEQIKLILKKKKHTPINIARTSSVIVKWGPDLKKNWTKINHLSLLSASLVSLSL